MKNSKELKPMNSQKSFYGKAIIVKEDDGSETLYSYGVKILNRTENNIYTRYWNGTIKGTGKWSATTGKHINAFCGMNKAEFLALPYNS